MSTQKAQKNKKLRKSIYVFLCLFVAKRIL
jgi:hypothetical protein